MPGYTKMRGVFNPFTIKKSEEISGASSPERELLIRLFGVKSQPRPGRGDDLANRFLVSCSILTECATRASLGRTRPSLPPVP